jgi:TonB family protein
METQEISAPVERPTREAPKRQVGYGLPCAKCHKYFPADLEVCPICKGRERVSPTVAPKIKKPVQSETSVAASSTNVALKLDVKESPKSESPSLAPPVEIKGKDRLVDPKDSIPTPVVAKFPAASEPARPSLVSTPPVLNQKEKESPQLKSPAVAAPVEVKVKDKPLDKKEPVKSPAIVKLPAAAEPAPASLASTQTVSTQEEKQSPQLEFPVVAPPVETNAKDEPFDHKELIKTPMVAETPVANESARASLVSTQLVVSQKEKESPKLESAAFAAPVEIKVKDQPLALKESIAVPVVAETRAAVEPSPAKLVSTPEEKKSPKSESLAFAPVEVRPVQVRAESQPLVQKESTMIPAVAEIPASVERSSTNIVSTQEVNTSPKLDAPALAPPIEIKVKDQPLEQKESTAVPFVQLPAAVGPLLASLIPTPKPSPKEDSPGVRCGSNQPNNDRANREEPIAPPTLLDAQASDPVPAVVVPRPEEKERTTELKPAASALPMQPDTEEQRRDKINQALRIVIPMLIETQVSEPAPVAAKQEALEQEKKEQAPKMSEVPKSAFEVKIAEAKPVETKPIEVKPVTSPAVVGHANHLPVAEKSKTIDKRVDAPPKPADVNAPVVVHVNLGELRAAKSKPECAPAQSKEIQQTEPESSSSDIASDADTSEPLAPVGGRKLDLVTFALGVVVLACAVLLIALAAIRLMPRHASEPVRRAKPAYSTASPTADQNVNPSTPTPPPAAPGPVNSASSNSSPVVAPASAPPASKQSASAGSSRVLTLPEGLAEGNLLYRVEPDYPEEARRQGVQGPVVLDLHISKEGLVQAVDLVSGQPLLAQAATTAVRQWRFRTRFVNGNEVEMQARITLHFALPTP